MKIESIPTDLSLERKKSDDEFQNELILRKGEKFLRIHSLDVKIIHGLCENWMKASGDHVQFETPCPDLAIVDKDENVEVFARIENVVHMEPHASETVP